MVRLFRPYAIRPFSPNDSKPYTQSLFSSPVSSSSIRSKLPPIQTARWNFTSTGRSSIYWILRSFNVKPNDGVIVPAYLCPSVYDVLRYLRVRILFCDIDRTDLNISIASIRKVIVHKPRFIIIPSLYGNPANIVRINNTFPKLILIDDAAQAYGATVGRKPIGTFGDAGFYSVGPGKPLYGAEGSVFWTTGRIQRVKNKKKFLYYTILYLNFLYNRVFGYVTQYFPLTILGFMLYWIYAIIQKLDYSYDVNMSILDKQIMKRLIEDFPIQQRKVHSYETRLHTMIAARHIGHIVESRRGKGIAFRIVILCRTSGIRTKLMAEFRKSSIFYSLGYQPNSRYFRASDYPNLSYVLPRIIEFPLPNNEKELIIIEELFRKIYQEL